MGSFLAARLSQCIPVILVVRNSKLARAVNTHGITVYDSKLKTHKAYSKISCVTWKEIKKFPEHSKIFVTTKAYHLKKVSLELARRNVCSAKFIFCQNGLGIFKEVKAHLNKTQCVRASVWLGVKKNKDNEVELNGLGPLEFALGKGELREELHSLFKAAGIPVGWCESVTLLEWKKALANIAVNGLGSLLGVSNGVVLKDPCLKVWMQHLLDEAFAVAKKDGVLLTPKDLFNAKKVLQRTSKNFNSSLQDLRVGRPTEIPWLNGTVVELAEKHGIPVFVNQMIGDLIGFLERKAQSK